MLMYSGMVYQGKKVNNRVRNLYPSIIWDAHRNRADFVCEALLELWLVGYKVLGEAFWTTFVVIFPMRSFQVFGKA